MIKKILFLLLTCNYLFSNTISSDDDYYIYESKYYCIIYTKQYKNEAKFIKINIDEFLKHNNKLFSYSFDEPIKIVLISNKNQVANAFSTQIPFNKSVYYNGGGGFAISSWLSLVFVHEMMHNYQINAKKSVVSQTMHKYFRNNIFSLFYKYNYLKSITQDVELHEYIFGITFDILAIHLNHFPFVIKYIVDEQGSDRVSFQLSNIF